MWKSLPIETDCKMAEFVFGSIKWTKELSKVEKELSQYSWKAIIEFDRIFHPVTHYDPPGTQDGGKYGKYNYYSQNIIPKEGKSYIVNITMLYENTYEDFWVRWNRFKNLKVYL